MSVLASQLSQNLDIQITRSEYKRNQVMVALLCTGFFIVVINYWMIDEKTLQFYGGSSGFVLTIWWMLTFLLYELVALVISRAKVLAGESMSYRLRLVHVAIEALFPTALLLNYVINGMVSAIDAPIAFVYFLTSVLSILCLDYKISLFSGIFSGFLYAVVVFWGFEWVDHPIHMPTNPSNTYFVRSVLIVLSGAAAAFVSLGVRGAVTSLLEVQFEKTKIEKIFGQQVSKEVADALVDDKTSFKRQEATVLALDLRNFSTFAEHRSPDEILAFQNQVFGPIIEIINQHQGIVNQIMGDGLMATFGTPTQNPLHADMAFQASLKIIARVEELNRNQAIPNTRLGLGLHSGEVITGNIGNERRKQYSISGTAVIIAFRVEQLNKELNCNLLITEEVKNRIEPGRVQLTSMGAKPLKGFGSNVNIYKVEI